MKKLLLITCFLIPTLLFSQQIFQYRDKAGHLLNVKFSGNNLLAELEGAVNTFYIPPWSSGVSTWVSNNGYNIFLTDDFKTIILGKGKQTIAFNFQAVTNGADLSGNNYQQNNNQNNNNQPTATKHTCGYCNGTGWINDNSAPDFGTGSKWCEACGKMVPASHCHGCKRCPSCGGKGYN